MGESNYHLIEIKSEKSHCFSGKHRPPSTVVVVVIHRHCRPICLNGNSWYLCIAFTTSCRSRARGMGRAIEKNFTHSWFLGSFADLPIWHKNKERPLYWISQWKNNHITEQSKTPEIFTNAFITTDIHLQDKNYHYYYYYLVNSLKIKIIMYKYIVRMWWFLFDWQHY